MFLKGAMKKSFGDIELPCQPLVRTSNGKNSVNCGRFDDRRESFAEVDTGTLCEPVHHPAGFIAINQPSGLSL